MSAPRARCAARAPGKPAPHGRARRAGFTLIEMLAAVTILVLVATVVVPRLGLRVSQAALEEGREIGALLELARSSAIVSGRPQRVMLDLDNATYWAESGAAQFPPAEPLAWSEVDPLPLVAPRAETTGFVPLSGPLGRPTPLRAEVAFAGVETDAGTAEDGVYALAFAGDGSAQAARVWLEASDATRVLIEVAPLADVIRVGFAPEE